MSYGATEFVVQGPRSVTTVTSLGFRAYCFYLSHYGLCCRFFVRYVLWLLSLLLLSLLTGLEVQKLGGFVGLGIFFSLLFCAMLSQKLLDGLGIQIAHYSDYIPI